MKTKIVVTLLVLSGLINNVSAQKIALKDGKVTVDGKEFLSYKTANRDTEISLYKLNSTDELIFILLSDNQTRSNFMDDYYRINFLGLNLKMETHNWDAKWKNTIKWFLENGLFTEDGNLNEEKVKVFISKYNENISPK